MSTDNICFNMLWYSLEVPWQGTSNEYPQHVLISGEIRKISIHFSWTKKHLICLL